MTNPLAYSSPALPDDAVFKISPSAFAKFITSPHKWYRDEVLKENPFTHSTSTVIGTIVHYCAEMVAKQEMVDKTDIENYIDSFEVHEDYDPEIVRHQYPKMAEELVNSYVLENQMFEVETQHLLDIGDGYYAGGTLDRLEGEKGDCMIVDYKTYNSKTKPKAIPAHYKYQLLVYASILRNMGYNPTRIRLVYINRDIDGGLSEKTGKPLKSYPPEVTVLTETLVDDDFDFIESQMELAIDSLIATEKYPELTHIIWHDPRLKSDA